jgi:protein tyrosine phosphatase
VFYSHPVNAAKNRYADVLCLEHSRVKLTVIDEDDVSRILFIAQMFFHCIIHN